VAVDAEGGLKMSLTLFAARPSRNLETDVTDLANPTAFADGNTFRGAIARLGRKVLIDEARFLEWIRDQSVKGNS
jgi:hypothetical protein